MSKIYIPKDYQIKGKLKVFRKLLKSYSTWGGIIASLLGFIYAIRNEVDILNFIIQYRYIFFIILIIFIAFFSVPFFYIFIIFIKYLLHLIDNVRKKNRDYLKVINLWDQESKKNNIIKIPQMKLETYKNFMLDFKNEGRKLKEINFKLNKIWSQQNHNWNLKIAFLRNNEDYFYIILHTKMQNESGGDNELHIAIENKNLEDTIQKHEIFKNIDASKISKFKIKLIYCKDVNCKLIKTFIDEQEIRVLNRIEKISDENLNNVRLELFSSLCFREPVMMEVILKDFNLIWEL